MIVIADDITGAAEIAAIAKRWGYKTSLMVYEFCENDNSLPIRTTKEECLVIATNTRSFPTKSAIQTVKTLAESIRSKAEIDKDALIFKKVDSALRGHVVEEIEVLKEVLCMNDVLYIPCNPSKGRIIKNGVYYIDGQPLNETSFANDPEFPAYSASLNERFPNLLCKDATTVNEIQTIIDNIPRNKFDQTLFVGAADMFNCLCKNNHLEKTQTLVPFTLGSFVDGFSPNRVKILLGSTQSDEKVIDIVAGHKMSFCPMPESVFMGEDNTSWAQGKDVCLYYPQHRNGNPSWLTDVMARSLKRNIDDDSEFLSSSMLIIEGGASAFAVLTTMGWGILDVKGELAPGVTVLMHNHTMVILKPGSYPWKNALNFIRSTT